MLMTVSDVAEYLKLSDKTVLKLVRHGEIPCAKIANQWRFSTSVLEQWIAGQMILPSGESDQTGEPEEIGNILRKENVVDLEGETLWDILRELAEKASENRMVEEPDLFVEELVRNDGISSTLLGSGILLLHLRFPQTVSVKCSGAVAGYTARGLSAPSLSDRRAKLVIFLLSPEPGKERPALFRLMDVLSNEDRVRDLLTFRSGDHIQI